MHLVVGPATRPARMRDPVVVGVTGPKPGQATNGGAADDPQTNGR